MPPMIVQRVDPRERRRFLQLMAASAALASGACSGPPPEQIVPYVDTPRELVEGHPLFYATAYVRDGYAHGVLVESNMGRPTKAEGNVDHPASLGATDVYAQASILELWDPERSRSVVARDAISSASAYDEAWLDVSRRLRASRGEGLRILTARVTSPTMLAQLAALTGAYPQARWHGHAPGATGHAAEGARLAFGRALDTIHAIRAARIVLALDADFLSEGPGALRHARELADRRRAGAGGTRLYAIESTPGLAGACADERLALAPAEIERVAWRIAAALDAAPRTAYPANPTTARFEAAVAKALRESAGECVVIAGERLGPSTHALVHRLNAHLGNVGRTLHYIEPVARTGEPLADLVYDMRAGRVEALVVIGANPVYDAPGELGFADALERVPFSVHCGLYRDETARASAWHLPQLHDYEQWSDARAFDGTLTVVQPVLRPLHDARSPHELLARIAGGPQHTAYEIVREAHRASTARDGQAFEAWWRESLRRGLVAGTAHASVQPTLRAPIEPPTLEDAALVAVVVRSPRMDDGRYANNAWLQELPHPLTKTVWDNALLIGPRTAHAFALASGDVVRARVADRSVEGPVDVVPTHAEGVATLILGYGRWSAGRIGDGVGFDAYRLLPATPDGALALSLEKTGGRHRLVRTQVEMDLHGREQVRSATLEEYTRDPDFAHDEKREQVPEESLYPPFEYPTYAWGMAIDLNACIGCGACTIACQSENNIPVVGKTEVDRGREMHWIRVDHYVSGLPDAARDAFMPVPCMHCENAPCEEVCPVGATMHDAEGLNVQVYNRCVGTRFCNQNCPYKVRRFNFLKYADDDPLVNASRNPEVTVRRRGVMEKCTYCVQRISRARIEAEKDGRRIRDGEVVTACQAVCPTRAIHFGDLNDPRSAVRQVKASPLEYALLAELNTRPHTTYLAKVIDRDPELG